MARQSLSVLVLLVLCRYAHAQDAPFRIVQDPVAFERVAVRTGLTAVQAEEVLRTLAVPKEAPPQGIGHAFAEWRAREMPKSATFAAPSGASGAAETSAAKTEPGPKAG